MRASVLQAGAGLAWIIAPDMCVLVEHGRIVEIEDDTGVIGTAGPSTHQDTIDLHLFGRKFTTRIAEIQSLSKGIAQSTHLRISGMVCQV